MFSAVTFESLRGAFEENEYASMRVGMHSLDLATAQVWGAAVVLQWQSGDNGKGSGGEDLGR